MDLSRPIDFSCPHCQARYKTVRVPTEPGSVYQMLHCVGCDRPLPATEGDNVVKYFLVSPGTNGRAMHRTTGAREEVDRPGPLKRASPTQPGGS